MFGDSSDYKDYVGRLTQEVDRLRYQNIKLTILNDKVKSMLSTARYCRNEPDKCYWVIEDKYFKEVSKAFEDWD